MKNLLLSVFIAIPFLIQGQFNSSIDFIAGIDHSYRVLGVSPGSDSLHFIVDVRQQEKAKSNFRVGFNFNKRVTSKISLKTGIRLASVGYIVNEDDNLHWPSEHDGMGGWKPDPSLHHTLKFVEDYWFIEIPLVARFELNQKKLAPFIEVGVMPNFYLTTRVVQELGSTKKVEYREENHPQFNPVSIAGNICAGLNYNLSPNFQLFGQSIARYHFTKTFDAPIVEHLYNVGIECGIRKKLKFIPEK